MRPASTTIRNVTFLLCAIAVVTPSDVLAEAGPAQRAPRFQVEKEFAGRASGLQELLDTMADKVAAGGPVSNETRALRDQADDLLAMDPAMQEVFAARQKFLSDQGLPESVIERHRRTVEGYRRNLDILLDNVDAIENAQHRRSAADVQEAVRKARRHLRKHKGRDPQRFLAGNLPLQPANTKPAFKDISEARARMRSREGGAAAGVARGVPVPADLAATIDVQLTTEVSELAEELGNSPLAIYRHVRDNFRFEPYTGSRKGSRETLLVGGGNAFDLASALIALLRAADIPARYVVGEVLMPAQQVKDWLGVTDGGTAAAILSTAGLGATAYTDGDEVVAIAFEHVWVSAYVPYGNYRGIPNDDTGKTWVALDPSFKVTQFAPVTDIPSEMGFDAGAFIDDYISTFHEPSPVELYLQQIEAYVDAEHPELVFPDDVFRTGTIVADTTGVLPGSLPYTIFDEGTEFAELPEARRHRVRFVIRTGATPLLDKTLNLPEIASRRTTISYIPATPADEAVIDSYGDLYATPPDLIDLKPVLKIEGVAVATGTAIGAGVLHNSDIHFMTPSGEGNPVPIVQNVITAGTYQGIGIDTFTVAPEALVNGEGESLPDADGLTGEKLYRTAMTYLDRVDQSGAAVAGTMQMVINTAVSDAIVENVIQVAFSFGTPVAWEWKGLVVDADRKIIGPFAIDGDESKHKPFFVLAGADGSTLENRVFEDLYGQEAVSTIKILELASDMGVQICRIVTSIAVDCPTMSQPAAVVNAVNAAIAQGHEVTIPRTTITYLDWTGTGYIDMEPDTGAAGYIISGGQSGGATVDAWTSTWRLFFAVYGKDVCNIIAVILSPAENSNFPYPGPYGGLGGVQPSSFEVDYTVYYCDEEDGEVTVSETYIPHFQYPPGNFIFHAGWGTGATRAFTVFDVQMLNSSDQHMGKGYTGAPVAGDPEPVKLRFIIRPSSFVPSEVKLFIKRGMDLRTMTLPNTGGMQEVSFDGKTDGGAFLDTGAHTVRVRVKSPDDKTDTSDEGPFEVVEVIKVELFDEDGVALEDNAHPDKPGGKRIFTGRKTPAAGSRRNKAKVRATLSAPVPSGKLKVSFASFDVVDPTGLIDANHGSATGTPAEGAFTDSNPPTDGDNTVDAELTVTMQPGDNFKSFASTNANLIGALTDAIAEANTSATGETSNARLMPLAAPRLTVWRYVHVEQDSMGDVAGNTLSGTISLVTDVGNGTSRVFTNLTLIEQVSAVDRFQNGVLRNDGKEFAVIDNIQGMNIGLTVRNIGAGPPYQLPKMGAFTLVDDDDQNSDDAPSLNGDAGENVRNPNKSRFGNADDTASNAFAPAYVKPVIDIGDTNADVAFVLNTPDGADEKTLLLATYDFDEVATEADNDFWTVYLFGAYQMQTEEDGDPRPEGATLGQVDEIHGQGASIFIEAARDASPSGGGCIEPITTSHEVGHLFSALHGDGGQMTSPCNGGTANFSNASIMRFRNLDHP